MRSLALLVVCAPLFAQHGSSTTVNPFTSPDDAAAGARLYRAQCSGCHGVDGGGAGAGPSLTSGNLRHGATDPLLYQSISKGVPGTTMPAFEVALGGKPIWQLVAHLRSLTLAKGSSQVKGDALEGAKLYAANCVGCHGAGGTAPDLTGVTKRRTVAELRTSILDPHAQVASEYFSLRIRLRSGQELRGIRLNEDTGSIQMRTAEGKLTSVLRSELADSELIRRSPMPEFASKLSASDIENLIAYLAGPQLDGAARESARISPERLREAVREPQNWLTYNGTYSSIHHSALTSLRPDNVKGLDLKWMWQSRSGGKVQATPIVLDGVMYLTDGPNDVVALDGRTGRVFWRYRHPLPPDVTPCCGQVNRGLAILGNSLFLATLDGRLISLDASTGRKRWDVEVVKYRDGYALTLAPLAIKDKIIIGPAGGELGIRGFIAAYDAQTGVERWRFNTVPGPGEPGNETWAGNSWKTGGASVWLTGSYDPELNLTYWGIGNPGPDWNPYVRLGDNLYSDCVVALDVDTGKLKWHFQFTPNDGFDFDAVQIPVLIDREWKGKQRKLMLWANRNAFFYVLDRATGEFLLGTPFSKQDWAKGLDDKGRPMKIPERLPSKTGSLTYPGVQGGTNWYAPSFSPRTGLFYLTAWDDYPGVYYTFDQEYQAGKWYAGGSVKADLPAIDRREIRTWGPEAGYGAVRALDPATGKRVWEYKMTDVSDSGLLTTATDLLFSGNREGHFFALDARDGKLLWTRYLGGQVANSPITWAVDGKQYVSVASGHGVFTFGLPDAN